MSVLRFFMLLSLAIWLGGIIFFAAAVAPTVFAVLPTRHLAGSVVNRSLAILHWMGLISGLLFLSTSMAYSRALTGTTQAGVLRHVLVWVMIGLTLVSMYAIGTRMAGLRAQMGVVDDLPASDARRVQFNRLHQWSTRLETSVLIIGLVVLYLTARQLQ